LFELAANGAGKTTFDDVITGRELQCDSGTDFSSGKITIFIEQRTEAENLRNLASVDKFQKPNRFEGQKPCFDNFGTSLKTTSEYYRLVLGLNTHLIRRIDEVLKRRFGRASFLLAGLCLMVKSNGLEDWHANWRPIATPLLIG